MVRKLFTFLKRKLAGLRKAGVARLVLGLSLIGCYSVASAASAASGISLSVIATNIATTIGYFSTILTDIALVAGIGFVLAALFKFHQHKQNPTQVQISQGVTLLIIGAALLIFPYILTTAKKAVFGSATVAKLSGGAIQGIIGS